MASKLGIRIISISLALVLMGMVAPSLTNGAVTPKSVPFGEVVVGSQKTEVLNVSNPPENVQPMDVSFYIYGDDCGFSVSPETASLEVGGDINVDVIFTPTQPGECSAALWVVYAGYGAVSVSISGTGTEAPSVSPTVVIDDQDTTVENKIYEGKHISEWTDECAVNARNHGQYVRCMALMTRKMRKARVLEEEEGRAIMKAAAHANIPPRESGLEELSHEGTPVTDLIKACKDNAKNNGEYTRCVSHLMKDLKKEGVIKTRKEKHQIRRYAARLRFHSRHHK